VRSSATRFLDRAERCISRGDTRLNKMTNSKLVLALMLSSLLATSCASISKWHERMLAGAAFSELHAELNAVARVEQIGGNELVVRFPQTALFGVGEYFLQAGADQNLGQVAEILCRYPEYIIIVEGHTDSRGRESYNQWLSERRSRVVADLLVSRGLEPNRIQVIGYGESRPLTANETPEGRQRNRRVELHIKPRQP